MMKLGLLVLVLSGCEQGGATTADIADLRSRVDQLGNAINETHAACSGDAPPVAGPQAPAVEPQPPEEPRAPREDRGEPSPLAFAPTVRTGRVATSTGETGVAVGDHCYVQVWHVLDDSDAPPWNCRVRVMCGQREIYGPETGPASTGTWAWLFCSVRDGRPDRAYDGNGIAQEEDPLLRMDLTAGTLTVSDEGYSVGLRLDPEASGPTNGATSRRDGNAFAPTVRFGHVSAITGTPPGPLERNASCVVQLWPEERGSDDNALNGRANVLCGATHLYGPDVGAVDGQSYGYLLFGVRGGQPAIALDQVASGDDSDPQLEVDMFGGTVVAADTGYRVEIALDH